MTNDTSTALSEPISWDIDIPLLTNRFLVWDTVRVMFLAVAMMYVFVFVGGLVFAQEVIILPAQVFAVTLAILLGLLLATGIVLGNRIGARFTVDAKGVTYEARKRERVWSRVAVVLGLLAGKPSVAGAGMLAVSREREHVSWSRVERVVIHRRERVVELRNSWRALQRLHCPPELFEQVVTAVEAHVAGRRGGRR